MRFALIMLAGLLLPSQQPAPKQQSYVTTGGGQKANTDQRGTQGDPLVVHIKGTEQTDQEAAHNKDKDDTENRRKVYELLLTGVIALATVAQVATASIQACIYLKQSRIMHSTLVVIRKQATTMASQNALLESSVAVAKQSAETAANTLKAMIDKERALLSLEIEGFRLDDIPTIKFKITCHGTTPAHVVSSWESVNLNPIPDYGWPKDAFGVDISDMPSVFPVGVWEGSAFILGDTHEDQPALGTIVPRGVTLLDKVYKGELFLHFRIRILYKDVFDSAEVHELQISKVYGLKKVEKPQTLFERLYSLSSFQPPTEMVFNTYPTWEDSAYKFGQTEEKH
jgi:hypothetical protein